MNTAQNPSPRDSIEFLPFNDDIGHWFRTINKEWISEMFEMEAGDYYSLDHPRANIIDKGGKIWFVRHPELGIVGTGALLNRGEGQFELTKMGVLKKARGMKIGEPLLCHILGEAKKMKIKQLFLLTNKRCEAAIHLYEKHGFVHDAGLLARFQEFYARSDVAMRYTGLSSI